MHGQLMLTAALFATPPERPPPDPFESELDQVEVTSGDDDAQIIAYDSDGEVIGTMAIWVEPDGRVHLASDYGDGYAETVLVDGRAQTEATLPPDIIATRADAMFDMFVGRESELEKASKLKCALKISMAAAACAAASIVCPFAMGGAACECLPAFVDEWKDYSCPGL